MKTHISSFHALWWTEKKKSQTEHLSQYMYLSGFRDVTILNGKVTKKKSHTNNMWQLFLLFLFWKECHTSNMLKIKHIALFVTFVTFFEKIQHAIFPKTTNEKWLWQNDTNKAGIITPAFILEQLEQKELLNLTYSGKVSFLFDVFLEFQYYTLGLSQRYRIMNCGPFRILLKLIQKRR